VRRAGLVAGAVVCVALAALLTLLAADALRWHHALRADDVRYQEAPGSDLWNSGPFVPLGAARTILGVDDDLAFRRAVRALRLARLEDTTTPDTRLVLQRAEAEVRLEAIAAGGGDPARRSRAMALLGVFHLATPVADAEEQATALKAAVANLQEAIALDPDTDEAKFNLEYALLQRRGGLSATGGAAPNPSGSGSTTGAATGSSGSGY
jgi:hypothetical protein